MRKRLFQGRNSRNPKLWKLLLRGSREGRTASPGVVLILECMEKKRAGASHCQDETEEEDQILRFITLQCLRFSGLPGHLPLSAIVVSRYPPCVARLKSIAPGSKTTSR